MGIVGGSLINTQRVAKESAGFGRTQLGWRRICRHVDLLYSNAACQSPSPRDIVVQRLVTVTCCVWVMRSRKCTRRAER